MLDGSCWVFIGLVRVMRKPLSLRSIHPTGTSCLTSLAVRKTWIVDMGPIFFCSHPGELPLLALEPAIPVLCAFPWSWTTPVELRTNRFSSLSRHFPVNKRVFFPLHLNWKTEIQRFVSEELERAPLLDIPPVSMMECLQTENVKFLSALAWLRGWSMMHLKGLFSSQLQPGRFMLW